MYNLGLSTLATNFTMFKHKNNLTLWSIWLISASFVLFQFLLQASPSVMIPQLMHALSINITHLGFVSASFYYPYVLAQIPAGFLIDRFGPRKVILLSLSICTLSCLLFAYSSREYSAELSRILMGLSCSPAVVCTLYLGKTYFAENKFALVAGLLEMLGMLGGAIGETLLAMSVRAINWRNTMIICALTCLIILLLAALFIKTQKKLTLFVNNTPPKPCSLRQSLRLICTIREVWLSALYAGLMFTVVTSFAALWAVPFMLSLYHISTIKAATLSSIIFIGAASGAPCYGVLAGRLPNYQKLLIHGAFWCFLLMSAIVFIPNIPQALMYVLLFFLGFFSASYVLPFDIVKRIVPPKTHGSAMGYTNMMCLLLGAPILQPLIGYLLNKTNIHDSALNVHRYQLALIPILLSLLLAFWLSFSIKAVASPIMQKA